jgi:hypothetical protein
LIQVEGSKRTKESPKIAYLKALRREKYLLYMARIEM